MRTLIAISACEKYESSGLHKPMRDTWLSDATRLGLCYKFFHGRGATPKEDVVVLDCDDSYDGLIRKFQMKVEWAYHEGYDQLFSCLSDCYVCPERLIECARCNYDYFGSIYTHETFGSYCQGGAGFLISRKSMLALVSDNLPLRHRDGTRPPTDTSEDAWAGQALGRAGILPVHTGDFKIWLSEGGPRKDNTTVTTHLSYTGDTLGYRPEDMYRLHKEWTDSNGLNQRRDSLRFKRPV